MTSTNEIRSSFLDFFAHNGHEVVPSAPLVPYNDPTLMFTNAGMVPFKNVFTGLETRATPRAASSQKCVRAGGKHNDLDNVGYTARHHTFFEMLGNFSFGDYFKEQAISQAWALLSREWGLPAEKLLVTVYHDDDEAHALWRKISGLADDRIIRIATSDNFWAMGETGPCGPCSEIFYDHGPEIPGGPPGSAEEDGDRFIEIWNLVFMQFETLPAKDGEAGARVPLPRPSIDTGMGLERIAAVMQGVHDNYDIDTFRALIAASESLTGTRAVGGSRASHRVIADHLRASGFLLADGVLPANEGRGYVLRRIMRRAMRHAHLLGADRPLLHRLVPALAAEMGAAYPELVRAQPLIEDVLEREEARFRQTLDKGLKLLDEAVAGLAAGAALPGETAFRLYDTYGFPLDLTEDALRARGHGVDRAGFDAAMAGQRSKARAAWKGSGEAASGEVWFDIAERLGATEFTGYTATTGEGKVVALVKGGAEVASATAGDEVFVLTNQTPFYGESGGQTGDSGRITGANGLSLTVVDTAKPLGRLHAHRAKIDSGTINVGESVSLAIDVARRDAIRANHSATHLLHAALRNRLGAHVTQKGSLVAADRFRFDFSHPHPLSAADIAAIEAEVNAEIRANEPVTTRLMAPEDAIAAGAMALFGEKYGDEVRVLSMGRRSSSPGGAAGHYSVELCGGTHVRATGDIALLRIISEGAVAAGVRRIEALTGEAARTWLVAREDALKATAALLKAVPDEVGARVAALVEERKKLERELAQARRALALAGPDAGGAGAGAPEAVGDTRWIGQIIEGLEPKALKPLADEKRRVIGSGVVTLIAVNEGANTVVQAATEDVAARYDSVALVRVATAAMGHPGAKGTGGGRADMAQGGGPAGRAAAEAALAAVRAAVAG